MKCKSCRVSYYLPLNEEQQYCPTCGDIYKPLCLLKKDTPFYVFTPFEDKEYWNKDFNKGLPY